MKKQSAFKIFTAAVLFATGCTSNRSTDSAATPLPSLSHSREITNPYLPLASLKQDILQNKVERVERTAKSDVHKMVQVGGQHIDTLAVEDREFDSSGNLTEVTLDYFAQDDDGNVYYMGEDVDEYENRKISGHAGAWLFGKNTINLGLMMPAHPITGDQFKSENVASITWEADEVESVSESTPVPKLTTVTISLPVFAAANPA